MHLDGLNVYPFVCNSFLEDYRVLKCKFNKKKRWNGTLSL